VALGAAALAQQIYGPYEKLAYTRSGTTGAAVGLAVGFGIGAFLVLRDGGRVAGPALAWLWVGAAIVLACLIWVMIQ
jgi:hypothetical protein